MIGTFFLLLSLLIWARIIFSFTGYNYGPVYDFVYTYSEKLLLPVRKRLPKSSSIDWSPFIVLIFLDIFSKLVGPVVYAIVNGEWANLFTILASTAVSLISSVITFFIIMTIVKIINDLVRGQYSGLSRFLDALIEPFLKRIRGYAPAGLRHHSVWIFLVLLFVLKLITENILESIKYGI